MNQGMYTLLVAEIEQWDREFQAIMVELEQWRVDYLNSGNGTLEQEQE